MDVPVLESYCEEMASVQIPDVSWVLGGSTPRTNAGFERRVDATAVAASSNLSVAAAAHLPSWRCQTFACSATQTSVKWVERIKH